MDRPGEYGEDPPPGLETMWGMDAAAAAAECDCPGPPPEFMLPPPPRPPMLQPADPMYCTEDPLPIETCDAQPVSGFLYQLTCSLSFRMIIQNPHLIPTCLL